jgi:EAL domain-containing protein (putative c-di-GMP-specific phosphodiesterase class I)
MMNTIVSGPENASAHADVLLLDDDELVLRAVERALRSKGYSVKKVRDGATAIREALSGRYEVLISDIHMPAPSGIDVLAALRNHDCHMPVVLMTGVPSFESARDAVEYGAVQYLTKPLESEVLVQAVARARRSRRASQRPACESVTDAAFERSLGSVWMAFQPIVSLAAGGAVAYEALVRSSDARFLSPPQLLAYAASAGRSQELGRAIRRLCARAATDLPRRSSLFVNLDAADLMDDELYSPTGALTPHAERVVLEVTERAALEEIGDVAARMRALRALGFRVAVDDLGAGYSGLSSIAVLEPDYVKLDMTLTRDLAASPVRRRLVASMLDACRDMQMLLIAEGVETANELCALRDLGCDLVQGYHFARPTPSFVQIAA